MNIFRPVGPGLNRKVLDRGITKMRWGPVPRPVAPKSPNGISEKNLKLIPAHCDNDNKKHPLIKSRTWRPKRHCPNPQRAQVL